MNSLKTFITASGVLIAGISAQAQVYTISTGQTVNWADIESQGYKTINFEGGSLDFAQTGESQNITDYIFNVGPSGGTISLSDDSMIIEGSTLNAGEGVLTIGDFSGNNGGYLFISEHSRVNVGQLIFAGTSVNFDAYGVLAFNADSHMSLTENSKLTLFSYGIMEFDLDSFKVSGVNEWVVVDVQGDATRSIYWAEITVFQTSKGEIFTNEGSGVFSLEDGDDIWTMQIDRNGITLNYVPEPSAWAALMGIAAIGFGLIRRRK